MGLNDSSIITHYWPDELADDVGISHVIQVFTDIYRYNSG